MRIDLDSMTHEEFEAYCAECDSRSIAEFRMRREMCGIRKPDIAKALGIKTDTVKKYESAKRGNPPSVRAWAYVDSHYYDLLDAVEAAIQQVEEITEANGEPESVTIAYRNRGPVMSDAKATSQANCYARAAVIALTALGYNVRVEWADEGIAALAVAAPRD